jgi:hypothetical protein
MGIGSELKKLGMKYDFSTSPLPVYMIKKGSKTFVLVNKKYAEKPDFVVGTTAGGLLESNSTNESTPKIKMNNLDWGKSTVERNANLDKYGSLKTDKEREEFLKKIKGESIHEGKNSMNHYISSKDGKTFTIYNKNEQKIKDVSKSQLEKLMRVGTNYRDSTDWNHFMASFDKSTSVGKYWKYWTGKLVNVTIAGLDESIHEGNAFGMAVTKAKQAGKKEFEFNGKIYKVKKGSYEKNESAKTKETVTESIDVKYWTDYHIKSKKVTDKSKVNSVIQTAIRDWNSDADGDNQVDGTYAKYITKLANEFFDKAGWLSTDVVSAMIMQE